MVIIILIKYLKKKKNDKRNWDFDRFPYGRDSTVELSLKCTVPGCKFKGFVGIYDKYQTILIERILTNNGRYDGALARNWNGVGWNYSEKRGRKRSMKVAIITHFAKMQQIDEYLSLLNVGADNG